MKKRLFLVNYKFTTAGHEYNEYKLVTIKYEGTMDQEWGMRLAEAQVASLFENTEGKLLSVVASTAIEKVYTQPKLSEKDLVDFGNKMIAKQAKSSEKTDVSDADLANYRDAKNVSPDDAFGWFGNDVKPRPDGEDTNGEEAEVSDLVLIDIDGKRETFVTGKWFYPFMEHAGWWLVDEHYMSALTDNLRWQYLNLAKYDK